MENVEMEAPLIGDPYDGDSEHMEELHPAPSGVLMAGDDEGGGGGDGDYPPIRNFEDAKCIWWIESTKLWVIAGPIAFNILCNYGINSFTNIFVGHIGDVELSAVAVALSVFGTFVFGFMVSFLIFIIL